MTRSIVVQDLDSERQIASGFDSDVSLGMNATHKSFAPIVLVPTEGLANRLRMVASGLVMAKRLNRPVELHWVVDRNCGAHWRDLFSTPMAFASADRVEELAREGFRHMPSGRDKRLTKLLRTRPDSPLVLMYCFEFRTTDTSYGEFTRQKAAEYRRFIPVDAVKSLIGCFEARHGMPEEMIGVHIRLGDWVGKAGGIRWHVSPVSAYKKAMHQLLLQRKHCKFLVCSDQASVETELCAEYKGHAVSVPKGIINRDSISGVQGALADWVLLSRCTRILGAPYSSFCQEAAAVNHARWQPVFLRIRYWRWLIDSRLIHPLRRLKLAMDQRRARLNNRS